jgi:hypothetical protein
MFCTPRGVSTSDNTIVWKANLYDENRNIFFVTNSTRSAEDYLSLYINS